MGEILGIGMSHFPGMRAAAGGGSNIMRTVQRPDIPDRWKDPKNWPAAMLAQIGDDDGRAHAKEHREAFVSECQALRQALDRFNPDFVLVWGDDQYENFKEDIIPAFCVFAYEDMEVYPYHPERDRLDQSKPISAFGRPAERPHAANAWDEPEDTKLHVHGKRDAAKYLARGLLKQKARYLEKKIGQDSDAIADLRASLEKGELKAAALERIPALSTYTLIHWVFESSSESRGYGFPFDRPHLEFYQRLKKIHRLLGNIKDIRLRDKAKDNRSFTQLKQLLEEVLADKELNESAANMETKVKVFDKLREALRIALPEGKNGLNDDGDEVDIKTIEKNVTDFRSWLVSDEKRKETYRKMIEQMDKYWKKLFADPFVVNTPEGQVTITPQRTNNILERFFRGEKRRDRKKSGTASLNKTLKTILADTLLIRNLKNDEYLRIILNGCSTLAERFSHIDDKIVREQLREAERDHEKIPKGVKLIIKQPDLPDKISALFLGVSKLNANCHLRS